MFRRIAAPAALVLIVSGLALLYLRQEAPVRPAAPPAARGGTITATLRAEPPTLNRFASAGFPTHLLSLLTDARLVRIDPATDEPVPWLALGIDRTETSVTITLRPGVRFSDGTPLSADDVVWSVRAAYGTPGGGIGSALTIGGEQIAARAESADTVVLTLPRPWAAAVRLLDVLPILPRAVVEPALADGTFASKCPLAAPCPGLGPFVVARYEPGQRVVLAPNPHYWRVDADGQPLPYLDGLTLEIVPDQNAEILRLTSGAADLLQSELRPEDIRTLGPEAEAGRLTVVDVGPGLDRHLLWFNLGPTPVDPARWFIRADAFRQAVSLSVDRQGFADTVFLGAAVPSSEPVPASNTTWTTADLPRPTYDPGRASTLLDGLGLLDRDNDGVREDREGRPVRFSVLVQSGISAASAGAGFLRDALANLGVVVDVVSLDLGGVMGRWQQGGYDAIFHMIQVSDTDPAGNLDFWMSRGGSHLWHPNQAEPATPWEAEIDRRMLVVASTLDQPARVREFAEVQRLMLTHNPVVYFATQRVYVAANPRVGGVTPKVTRPQILWRADELRVR